MQVQASAADYLVLTVHRNSKWNRPDNALWIQPMEKKKSGVQCNPCSKIKNDEKQMFVLS